ncbi:MAG: ATP synthase F0 subunit B [Bdellovibrionota bacterium]
MISDLQRQLGIDVTFFTQFVLFLIVFLWLRFVYFSPFLRLIQKREGQSDGLSEGAAKLEEESTRLENDYRERLIAARKRVAAEREQVLADARKQGNDLIAKARGEGKEKLDQSREQSQKEADTELANLQAQVGGVTALLMEKLTHSKVGL